MICLKGIHFSRYFTFYRPHVFKTLSFLNEKSNHITYGYTSSNIIKRPLHDFEINANVQDTYRRMDKVSKEFSIIYRAPMLNYLKYAHYISFSAALILPGATIVYLIFNGPFIFPLQTGDLPPIRDYFDFTVFYLGFFLMVSQIYGIIFRFPLRLYSDNNGNYVAVYRNILPWTFVNHSFKVGELNKISSFMPWGDSLYKFKSKKAILFEDHFLRPVDLKNMIKSDVNACSEEKKE